MNQVTNKSADTQNRVSRELEGRAVTERPKVWRAPETLPSPDHRDGWAHRWVRISVNGQADPGNIASKLREGYEPCKAEDYPELMLHAVTEGRFRGNIEVGGLLLCRTPVELMQQRADHFARQNKAQVESVDNNFLRQSDSRMPLFSEKSTKVSFGSGS